MTCSTWATSLTTDTLVYTKNTMTLPSGSIPNLLHHLWSGHCGIALALQCPEESPQTNLKGKPVKFKSATYIYIYICFAVFWGDMWNFSFPPHMVTSLRTNILACKVKVPYFSSMLTSPISQVRYQALYARLYHKGNYIDVGMTRRKISSNVLIKCKKCPKRQESFLHLAFGGTLD